MNPQIEESLTAILSDIIEAGCRISQTVMFILAGILVLVWALR